MPIKGVSDIIRFSRGGKIRIGEKKISEKGKEYPAKLDYFVPDFVDPELEVEFKKIYGDTPRSLSIVFVSEDMEVIFPQYFKCYGTGGKLLCKGDGCTAHRLVDGDMIEMECPSPEGCEFGKAKACRRLASLQFALPDLPVMQVFQFDTTSFNSIVRINSALALLRTRTQGRISGVEVKMVVQPQKAEVDGKRVTIYVVDIVIPFSLRDTVKSLFGPSNIEVPPLLDAPPTELIPRSVRETWGEPEDTIDPEQEAIFAARDGKYDPPQPTVADDPRVIAALDAAHFLPAKRGKLIECAIEGKWGVDQFVNIISMQSAPPAAPVQQTIPDAPAAPAAPPAPRKKPVF